MKVRLTKRAIEQLEPGTKDYDAWDTALPGFAVRVRPSGAKSYIYRYRPKGEGRSARIRTMTLGRFPHLAPELAREIAQRHLGAVAAGRDPARERPDRDERTVCQVLDAYLTALEGRPSHRVVRYDVKLHLKPALGAKRVADLKPADVEALRDRLMAEGKRRRAGAVVTLLRAALRRAKVDDTAALVKAPGHRRRKRVASAEELTAILRACRDLLQQGSVWPWAIYLVLLVLLTGARPAEWRTAKWSEVDWKRSRLVRREHKAARETGEVREIELPAEAVRLLERMPRLGGNPHIIPGKVERQPLGNYQPAWAAICKEAGVEGLWLYDGRRTFASIGLGQGFTLPQIARALGHSDLAAVDAYAWLQPSTQAGITARVANEIQRLSESPGTDEDPTGDKEPSGRP